MATNGLEIARLKTKAIILRGPRKREGIHFQIRGTAITPKGYVKCLGVWLDDKLIWSEHKQTCAKATRQTAALTKLLPNVRGPSDQKKLLLYAVVQSVILYAAPEWQRVTRVEKYRKYSSGTEKELRQHTEGLHRKQSAS
ncbi:hypothetical protein JTB14_019098 [Gonioctena quinquepunctata]|nr:hypothetical protein JTB14_019098 [Gonioctena quinquepunctata]